MTTFFLVKLNLPTRQFLLHKFLFFVNNLFIEPFCLFFVEQNVIESAYIQRFEQENDLKTYYRFLQSISFFSMPQIDKVTFLTTVYWTFIFYFFLYLDLNVTYLYKFLTMLKLRHQRMCWVFRNVQINALRARILASRAF